MYTKVGLTVYNIDRRCKTTFLSYLTLISGEVYSIQHHVIKFVSDLLQVSGFLCVLRFPPPIKLTAASDYLLII
jgi:hypothetical protein